MMVKIAEIKDLYKYRDVIGDLTYKEIADIVRSTEQAVKYWFTGHRKPNGSVLQCLEWYLNYCILQKEANAKLKRIYDYYQ